MIKLNLNNKIAMRELYTFLCQGENPGSQFALFKTENEKETIYLDKIFRALIKAGYIKADYRKPFPNHIWINKPLTF